LQSDRFGFFATIPMPHLDESVTETVRALDDLKADGVVLLANNAGTYLGEDGQDELFATLDERAAVVFIHPADLPGPTVAGVAPFAVDFLLDTTRAAFLLVRNGLRRRYPNIRFILSHAGGFVPYASHRMALAIMADTGASPADSLDDFSSIYFDTALSSSAAALPTLLSFAKPGHITFGSDWPFAPSPPGSSLPRDWPRRRAWMPALVMPSTGRTHSRCSPDSVRRRPRFSDRASSRYAIPPAGS
jgi:predicted TIM-barrel fold metal-dependent hydrolase